MNIDYFNGRTVESVTEGGDEGATWVIEFADNGFVYVFDKNYEQPTGLEGLVLTQVRMDAEITALIFGDTDNPVGVQVNLTPLNYGVRDEVYTEGELVYPQRANIEMSPAMQEYTDRVAERRGLTISEDDSGA